MRLVNDDNTSTAVKVETLYGNIVYIVNEKTLKTIATMIAPEILFQTNCIVITGHVKRDDGLYEMKSFHLNK